MPFRRQTIQGVDCFLFFQRPRSQLLKIITDPVVWIMQCCLLLAIVWRVKIIHAHEYQSQVMGWLFARLFGRKIVYDCHEYMQESIGIQLRPLGRTVEHVGRRIYRRYERWMTRRMDGVVAVTDEVVQAFHDDCSDIIKVPNYPSSAVIEAIKESTPSPVQKMEETFVFGFVGYVRRYTGIEFAVELAAAMKRSHPQCRWVFAGEYWEDYHAILMDLVDKADVRDVVSFTGRLEHNAMLATLKSCDAGLCMLQPEHLGNLHDEPTKFYQYCAFGLPIVATSLPPIRRMADMGGGSLLHSPGDFDTALDHVKRLVDDPDLRKKLADQSANAYATRFQAELVLPRIPQLYQKILGYETGWDRLGRR